MSNKDLDRVINLEPLDDLSELNESDEDRNLNMYKIYNLEKKETLRSN